jgi:hypothetical protein
MKRPFFIGYESWADFDGRWKRGERSELDGDALVRHAFVCGATGAGKTVFAKGVVEEALLSGVPVIAIDVKGDLASMALAAGAWSEQDLGTVFGTGAREAWSEYDEGRRGQRAVEDRIERYASEVDVRLFAPRTALGTQLAMAALPSFDGPPANELERSDRRSLVESLVRGLGISMFGSKASVTHANTLRFLEELVWWCAERGESLEGTAGVKRVVQLVDAPPFDSLGGLEIEEYLPPRQRSELRRRLAAQITGAGRDWFSGERLSVETLLGGASPGKTPLSIIYLANIADFEEQAFVVAQVCSAVYRWMRKRGGASGLELLVYMDEVGGGEGRQAFYPSHPYNPPSKGPMALLVKQGRSAGVGMLLATQNPVSVDVRALGNVNTWAIGTLTRENDIKRVEPVLESIHSSKDRLRRQLASLPQSVFLVQSGGRDGTGLVMERWLSSYHRTLSPDQVLRVADVLRARSTGGSGSRVPERASVPVVGQAPSPSRRVDGIDDPQDAWREPVPQVEPDAWEPTLETGATAVLGDWLLRWPGGEQPMVEGDEVVVGRSSSADVVLADRYVSGRHLRLVVRDSSVVLEPLKATNLPKIDGQRVELARKVLPKDAPVRIVVGKTELVLEVGG